MESVSKAKWSDDEEDQEYEMREKTLNSNIVSLPTKVQDDTADLVVNDFLKWTQSKQTASEIMPEQINKQTVRDLLQGETKNISTKENVIVRPITKLLKKDHLRSAVNSIDAFPQNSSLYCYSGIGKTARLLSLDTSNKSYSVQNSFFFESENPLKCKFVSKEVLVCQMRKKKYLNFFDIEKEKSSRVSKLFSNGGEVLLMDTCPLRNYSVVSNGKMISLIDTRSKLPVKEKHLMTQIHSLNFYNSQKIAFSSDTKGVSIYDIRYIS